MTLNRANVCVNETSGHRDQSWSIFHSQSHEVGHGDDDHEYDGQGHAPDLRGENPKSIEDAHERQQSASASANASELGRRACSRVKDADAGGCG